MAIITFKKTTPSSVLEDTRLVERFVYLQVNAIHFKSMHVEVEGMYFFYDENNKPIKLKNFNMPPIPLSTISYLESLNNLTLAGNSIVDAVFQRVSEFTFLQLDIEHQTNNNNNYGITSTNIEEL